VDVASTTREPSEGELVVAVTSLCQDRLRPYGRILKKRLAEIAENEGVEVPDAELNRLRMLCYECTSLRVEQEHETEWSALVAGTRPTFVDIYSQSDFYGEAFWDELTTYVEGLEDGDMSCPGGRYVCAKSLVDRNLPCLAARSLGEISHIVQLAMTQRKVLGYRNGAIVPYAFSETAVKERCAEEQRLVKRSKMPLPTWDMLRACLREMLLTAGTEGLPLSNVKRVLRSRFRMDLSETALGHANMADLFRDSRLEDLCVVTLLDNGYFLYTAMSWPCVSGVQSQPSILSTGMSTATDFSPSSSSTSVPLVPVHQTAEAFIKDLLWGVPSYQAESFCATPSSLLQASPIRTTSMTSTGFSTLSTSPTSSSMPFLSTCPQTPGAQQSVESSSGSLASPEAVDVEVSCVAELLVNAGSSSESTCASALSTSVPSTPRALFGTTPSPFQEGDFAQQLSQAVERAVATQACESDADNSFATFELGENFMVKNTFIQLVSPGLKADLSRCAMSLPATPWKQADRFSDLLECAVKLDENIAEASCEDSNSSDDAPVSDSDGECGAFTWSNSAIREFHVKNTFITIDTPSSPHWSDIARNARSLPTTPWTVVAES